MSYFQWVNISAFAVFFFAPFIFWAKKTNFLVWSGVPLFITAYLFPLLAVDYSRFIDESSMDLYTTLNVLGALAFLLGIFFGRFVFKARLKIISFIASAEFCFSPSLLQRIYICMLAGCVGMSLAFLWMGFVPMFAEFPFVAKFFKGQYKERYDQVSILYRLSQAVLITCLPFGFVAAWKSREYKYIVVLFWGLTLFLVALTRSEIGAGVLLFMLAWSLRSWSKVSLYLLISNAIYCFGVLFYLLLGLNSEANTSEVIQQLTEGMTDVADQLAFLQAFNPSQDLSYGLTFIGGLIPGNFYYNPSVFTLVIANGNADISDLASGGFRLPISLSGYIAYGFAGAFFVPLLSGVFLGAIINVLRKLPYKDTANTVVIILCFRIYLSLWVDFYALTYAKIIFLFVFLYIVYGLPRLQLDRAQPPHST